MKATNLKLTKSELMKPKPTKLTPYNAIVTIPPYAPYIAEVVAHPFVSGIRLNTVMPIKGTLEENLRRLQYLVGEKYLWIDLKCRQLRVKQGTYAVPPFTEIELSHSISVDTPTTAYFSDGQGGKAAVTVLQAEGNKLIMQDGPRRVVGPGESVNITDPSLKIEGYLTETDKQYLAAAQKVGLHKYMLSFVEHAEDIALVKEYDPQAEIAAKIESIKGLLYVQKEWTPDIRIMAARGDLYVELKRPHHIIEALEDMIAQDPSAIVASRILDSFAHSLEPDCADIGDVDNLLRMGYRTFMLGDEVCLRRESVLSALNLLSAVCERY